MRLSFLAVAAVTALPCALGGSDVEAERLGCTALAIDGAASATGAAFAVENTDCNMCDFRLNYVPSHNHEEGSMRAVFLNQPAYPRWVGYGRGEIYHPKAGEVLRVPVAHIPEVSRTYGYYESINPLMNDAGLGLGESSCGAMLQNKPPNSSENRSAPVGILDAMTMMELALERCATALCAVETLGGLSERYGYLPYVGESAQGDLDGRDVFADSGEAFTIADAGGEAWVWNVVGGVEGVVKSVWAAQRVPKGHVAVVSNEFTMGDLPTESGGDFRFCKDIHRAAIAAGLWDGKGALNFKRVFGPDPMRYTTGTGPPVPLYTSLRQWRLLDLAAPSAKLPFTMSHWDQPFSIKVDKPLGHRDVMEMMRDHYGGTEFDMTQGVQAGPFGTPFRLEGGPATLGNVPRGISIMRTLYSTITETGPMGSVLWYAPDTPASSVYVPFDSRVPNSVSKAYGVGHHREFDRSAAWWAFGFVSNWMQINYQGMSTQDVLPRMKSWQDVLDAEYASAKKMGVDALRSWQLQAQDRVAADWWKLADELVYKWNDLSHTTATSTDHSNVYPREWANMIGYSYDIHPVWVQPSSEPPRCDVAKPDCLVTISAELGYKAPTLALPRHWNFVAKEWIDWTTTSSGAIAEPSRPPTADTASTVWTTLVAAAALASTHALAFALGRRSRVQAVDAGSRPLLA